MYVSHHICVIINNVPVIVPFDKLGYKKSIKNWGIVTHIIQVYSEGPTKNLKIEAVSEILNEIQPSDIIESPEIEQMQFEFLLPTFSTNYYSYILLIFRYIFY